MAVSLKALIALENSANKTLRAATEPQLRKLTVQLIANRGDASKFVSKFDLQPHVEKVIPKLEELAMSAAIFGAAQLKPAHETLFTKGRNSKIVFKAARQMAQIAAKVGTEGVRKTVPQVLVAKSDPECRQILRKSVFDICCPRHSLSNLPQLSTNPAKIDKVLKADEPVQSIARPKKITVPADEDDISDALNAAVMGNGRLAADVAANLTTTRLAAYGFLAQAQEDGATEYQITAELDDRTCPVCAYMHGKTFQVDDALDRTEKALDADDPDDLKDIAPWPGQSRDELQDLLQMGPEELQDEGYDVPPFHPNCRCVLQPAGSVDDTVEPESQTEARQTTSGSSTHWFSHLMNLLLGGDNDGS